MSAASGQKRTSARYSIISLARSKIDVGMSMPTGQKPAFENAMAQVGCPDRRIDRIHAASATGSAAHEFASRPRCAMPAGSGRQLLGVSWDDLHDPGAGFSALDINDRDGISSLVITYTPGARPLLPLGAKCIALDRPFTVHHASKRPLIQSRTIRVPIDHTVPDLADAAVVFR